MNFIRINQHTLNLDRVDYWKLRSDDGGEQIDFFFQPGEFSRSITICKGENEVVWESLLQYLDDHTGAMFNL